MHCASGFSFVFGSFYYLFLKSGCESNEVIAESADSHEQIFVFFRVFPSIKERFSVYDVYLDFYSAALYEGTDKGGEQFFLFSLEVAFSEL